MYYFYDVIFFALGLIWGSFSNVVIVRLPENKSVISPRSKCIKCNKLISWYDNFPVVSWLILRGKCRFCKVKISPRYPVVELIMGVLFWLSYTKYGLSFDLLEILIFIFGLVTVSFIDFDHMILPDSFTLSGIVLGVLGAWVSPTRELLPSVLGVLVGGGFLWAIAYFYWVLRKEEGMGGGDIKLLAWIGAVLGWTSIPFIIMCSSIFGSIVGIITGLKSKKGLKSSIPFGPYLAIAAIFYIFYGTELSEMYFNFFIPQIIN